MFNLDLWKQQTAEKLAGLSAWLKARRDRDLPYLTYGALCAFTLTPVVEALARGELLPVMVTLGSVAGGVGGNLIAEQVQHWKDHADPDKIAAWAADTAPDNPDLRAALDAILQAVETIPQTQARLDETDRAWFTTALRRELEVLGSSLTVTASGDRAVAIGRNVRNSAIVTGDDNVTATGGSVAVGGDVGGDVVMPGGTKLVHPDPAAEARAHLRQTYLERLAHRCNALPLAALGADREAEEALTLDAVYVVLDTKTRIPLTEEEKKERKKESSWRVEDDRPLSALEAARQERRLALLGDPGSGKTTFVRQLAGRLARTCLNVAETLPGWDAPLFPLLTSLRRLAPALAGLSLDRLSAEEQTRRLVEAVCARWQADLADLRVEVTPAELERLLAGERLLVIFDGLDEVPDALRPQVNRAVQAVLRTYPNIERVIVTCRVRSYSGGAELSGFARHELAPFDADKILQFVAAWYGAQVDRLGQSEAERRANDLGRAVLDEDLFSLAQNPMLLTTMAIIHQQDARLPRERVMLYRRAVEILLQKWQKQKGLAVSEKLAGVLSDEMKMRAVLQLLAYRLHEQQARAGGDELPRKEIVAWLEAPAYLGDLALAGEFLEYVDQRAGLLVGRGGVSGEKPKVYDFPHRTFQEYLAGCYMASGRLAAVKREYRRRSEEGDFWQMAAQLGAEELLYNRDSPETLLDLAYSLCPVANPAEAGAWRRVLWSGRMAVVLGRQRIEQDEADEDNGPRYLARLLARLVRLVWSDILPVQERADAGRVLARLGDPRPEVMTVEGMQFCLVPAGPFVMGEGKEQHEVDIPYDYLIGRYPVTNAQYGAFVQAGGYGEARYWREAAEAGYWSREGFKGMWDDAPRRGALDYGEPFNLPNHPVVGVSWYEAVAYCRWLEELLKVEGGGLKVWTGDGEEILDLSGREWCIRLPSEAEWEKAARGGLAIPVPVGAQRAVPVGATGRSPLLPVNAHPARRYPWGDGPDPERANYGDTGIGTTSAVGCFPGGASPYGVEELSGNVWEWCSTKWREGYPFRVKEEWAADYLSGDAPRVLRGGAFGFTPVDVRCASRYGNHPYFRFGDYGFRVVLSPLTPLDSERSDLWTL